MLPDNKINYLNILESLKQKIRQARIKAIFAVNSEMLSIYWEIGNAIAEQEKSEGWGKKIVENLATDLKVEFPEMKGFSVRNLRYMRNFALAYPNFNVLRHQLKDSEITKNIILQHPAATTNSLSFQESLILQQLAAKLPWSHHMVLLDKVDENLKRLFYIRKCVENSWSRSILSEQIKSNLYERQGRAISNFSLTLPKEQSDLAQDTFKNPYILEFLNFSESIKERELERGLITHLKQFMLELGKGFAYVGNQKNLVVGNDDFFVDLLFYNFHLHCFVVFELKVDDFKPEYAGKLNFYVNAIDDQLKGANDNPTIGVLLCKTPNETVVKYSLKGIESPIGVADYELAQSLPKQLSDELPSVEELEAELDKEYEELKSPSQKRFENLKERLVELKSAEIKQIATTEILFDIVDKSLVTLYQALLLKMNDFKGLFYSQNCSWKGNNGEVKDIAALAENWKNEEFLKNNFDFYFSYWLRGFKKAGTETFDAGFQLIYKLDTYWYGFILTNYNNQQPFIKKLYHEQLTSEEVESIVDLAYNRVMDDIERGIEYSKNKN